jgi:hypothetical protein
MVPNTDIADHILENAKVKQQMAAARCHEGLLCLDRHDFGEKRVIRLLQLLLVDFENWLFSRLEL